jgi:MFS family permease
VTGVQPLLSRRYAAVSITIFTMVALSAFESLAVIAALPEIASDLGRVDLLAWIVTAYLIAATLSSVAAGAFIDSIGVRRIFLIGVLVFGIATVVAAAAPSMEILVAVRLLHGAGGGLVFTASLAAVPLAYPHEMVGRAYAAGATVWGVLAVAGPAIAAVVLTVLDWRWIFLVILPLVALGTALGSRTLPGPVDGAEPITVDLRGLALLAVFFVGLILALDSLAIRSAFFGAAAVVGAYGYIRHAATNRSPVVRLAHLLLEPYRSLWMAIMFLLIGGVGAYVFTPVYVRAARSASEGLTAWSVFFLSVGWTLGANISGRLQGRATGDQIILAGISITAVSLLVSGLLVGLTAPLWLMFTIMVAIGIGLGLGTNAAFHVLRAATPDATIGRVTAAHDFGRNIGFTGGTAIGGGILFAVMSGRIGDTEVVRDVLAGADVSSSADIADAVAAGFGAMQFVGAALAAIGVFFAWQVRAWRLQNTDSERVP